MLTQHTAGNVELLEADTTRHEVFSGNRKPDSKTTCKFHARLSGGTHCITALNLKMANRHLHRVAIEISASEVHPALYTKIHNANKVFGATQNA